MRPTLNVKRATQLLCLPLSLWLMLLASCASSPFAVQNASPAKADTLLLRPSWQRHFDSCGVQGAVALYDQAQGAWLVSDTVGIWQETLPASTFKIINLLIALETGVIQDEKEVVKWPGSTDTLRYGHRPEIYHDMTVEEAFEVSAGWVFVELAKRIGKDRYADYLRRCDYGNQDLSQPEEDFWNFGPFGISPMAQVSFLRKLHGGTLPFSQRNMQTVRRVMLTERLEGHAIHAKTGWTREGGINTGWWVGWVERKGGPVFFATRLLQDRRQNSPTFGTCRKEITRTVLREEGLLR